MIAASAFLFGNGDLSALDKQTLQAATSGLPSTTVQVDALGIVDLLAYVNNEKVLDPQAVISEDELLHGQYLLIRQGKKTLTLAMVTRY